MEGTVTELLKASSLFDLSTYFGIMWPFEKISSAWTRLKEEDFEIEVSKLKFVSLGDDELRYSSRSSNEGVLFTNQLYEKLSVPRD